MITVKEVTTKKERKAFFRFPLDRLLPPFESGSGEKVLEVVRGC